MKGLWDWLTHDAAGFFAFCLVVVGAGQLFLFFVQLKLIRESLGDAERAAKAAQDAADAAKTQANALMAAEGAHLYVVIANETIASTFQTAGRYDNSPTMHGSKMNAPGLWYVLRNYGKTPAILQYVSHGVSIQRTDGERRNFTPANEALEIVGVDADSATKQVVYLDKAFTFGDARNLVTEETFLYFYGEADYTDTFGATIKLQWEFIADKGKLRQVQHKEIRQTKA